MKKKSSKPVKFIKGCVIFFLVIILLSKCTATEDIKPTKVEKQVEAKEVVKRPVEPVKTPTQIEKEKHEKWVKGQFKVWDGSHKYLVDLIKENLNDAKSFEHVETNYIKDGDDLIVTMKYRAKNGFGATILQVVKARASYKNDTITVIE